MAKKRADTLSVALAGAGLEMPADAFVKLVSQSVANQRAVLHGPSNRELSEAEATAYQAGGFDLRPRKRRKPGPLQQALIDFVAMQSECRSVREVAALLSVDPSRVRQRLNEGSLYGFQRDHEWLLPDFQFHRKRPLPGLDVVVREIDPAIHPLGVFRFFTTPQTDLRVGGEEGETVSPRDWLRLEMDPAPVAELARDISQV